MLVMRRSLEAFCSWFVHAPHNLVHSFRVMSLRSRSVDYSSLMIVLVDTSEYPTELPSDDVPDLWRTSHYGELLSILITCLFYVLALRPSRRYPGCLAFIIFFCCSLLCSYSRAYALYAIISGEAHFCWSHQRQGGLKIWFVMIFTRRALKDLTLLIESQLIVFIQNS